MMKDMPMYVPEWEEAFANSFRTCLSISIVTCKIITVFAETYRWQHNDSKLSNQVEGIIELVETGCQLYVGSEWANKAEICGSWIDIIGSFCRR